MGVVHIVTFSVQAGRDQVVDHDLTVRSMSNRSESITHM